MSNHLKIALSLKGDVKKAYDAALAKAAESRLVERIWSKDHTVWRPDPTEISNRLDWLNLPEATAASLDSLQPRIQRLLDRSLTDVVLLGMGGSSLCPEVFRQTIGSREGHPRLHVLDTTSPDWVRRVSNTISLPTTLFIVASKSGGTIEVMSAFKYFWSAISLISDNPGSQFIAITDPDTGLAQLASERQFAETFVNNPNIGGRYSALSLFGIIPAMLMGMDARDLLAQSKAMSEACHLEDPEANPGLQLGLYMAACAAVGCDKLTLVMEPAMQSLGLWIEQLIAESTGKEETGILPIATEPLVDASQYGEDRAFAAISGPGKASFDLQMEALRKQGHPLAALRMANPLSLGAEFFRWEFATAVASHFLDIQPFDQPNVQEAKTLTGKLIADYVSDGKLPEEPETPDLITMLEFVKPGDYFAILAYIDESSAVEEAIQGLRRTLVRQYQIATTSGYGPRYLHSTGQYHKGGPNNGIFLQLTQAQENIPIPGEKYGFAALCEAQALGDYQALEAKGRMVSRVRLGENAAESIRALTKSIAS